MHFTKTQIEEIRRQLSLLGVRDTDLPDVTSMTGEEEVAIVQDGENKKVKIKDLFGEFIAPDIIDHLKDGESAYQVAVRNGFVGTEQEWLESLKGATSPATTYNLGGIKVGYPTNGKNYAVQLDGNDRAYVNVPWESGGGDTPTPPTPSTRSGYYELIFTATSTSSTPALPANQSTDTQLGIWGHSVDLSDNGKIIWMADRLVTDTVGDWMGPWIISGAAGLDGVDGDKMEFVYALTADPDTDPSDPTTSTPSSGSPVSSKTSDGFIPDGWTNHPSSVTSALRAEWVSYRFKVFSRINPTGTWTEFSAASLWSVYGQNGRDGDGVEYIFYAGTTLPSGDLPSSWENDEHFQDPEYIKLNSGWTDDPVDLEDEQSGYGMGTKQWVCTRKKYADSTPHATYGTDAYWHEYSDPALWSYYAQDGDAGTGIVADLLPDSMAIPLLESGYNKSYTATTDAVLYNGVTAVSGATASVVSVIGSNGTDYTSQGWVTASSNTITVNISAETINLSNLTLKVNINVSGTVSGDAVTRLAVLSIMGINFGTDGVSYTLDCGYSAIRKLTNSTLANLYVPMNLSPMLVEVTGTYAIQRYTASDLLSPSCPLTGFSIWYQLDDGDITKLTNNSFSVSGRLQTTNNAVVVYLMYNAGSGESIVLQEHIHVLPDAENGGHYVQAFRQYTGRGIPSAPSGYPAQSPWSSSAPNEGPVWMTECFLNGKGQMVGSWMTPWCISGSDGLNGYDGTEYEYIYTRTDDADPESVPDPNTHVRDDGYTYPDPKTIDDFVPQYWTDDAEGIEVGTGENTVEWQSHRCKTGSRNGVGGSWTEFTDPIIWSAAGVNGTDGAGVEYIYHAGLTPPTNAHNPNTWNDKNSDFQNTREYIPAAEAEYWFDNPIDLTDEPQGTKQWVSIRKKYLDDTEDSPWNIMRWHKYSEPALWSSIGRDAVINAAYADFENEMFAVGIDSNGFNYALSKECQAIIYYAGEGLPSMYSSVTNVSVYDDTAISYDEEGWVVPDSEDPIVRINIPAGTINLSDKTLTVRVDFESTITVDGTPTTFNTTAFIQIVGISFGEDGASYDMITNTRTIWNRDGHNDPSEVTVSITKCIGLDNITAYTVQQLRSANNKFTFTYQKDTDTTQAVELTASSISTEDVDSYLVVNMYYTNNGTRYLIDQETVFVGRDGTDGKSGIRLDLDNENDSILYDREGNKLSDNVISTATLYDGYDDKSNEVTSWSFSATGCHATRSNRTITVDAFSPGTTAASVEVSCVYKSRTYKAVLSVKKIVGDAKYDLRITPKDAIFYNTTTAEASSSTIKVEIIRTAPNTTGGVTKSVISTIPSRYKLMVDSVDVTSSYSNGSYTIQLSSSVYLSKDKYTISLYDISDGSLEDQETVYIARFTNGANGQNGTQAVCPFIGEYKSDKAYYGSYNRTDIVYYPTNKKYYIAKPNAPMSPFTGKDPLEDVNGAHLYWNEFEGNYESIATGFLFAEDLWATKLHTVDKTGKGIHAEGNELWMTDSTLAQRLRITGEDVDVTSPQQSFPTYNYGETKILNMSNVQTSHTIKVVVCNYTVQSSSQTVTLPTLKAAVGHSGIQGTFQFKIIRVADNTVIWNSVLWNIAGSPVSIMNATTVEKSQAPGTVSHVAGNYKIEAILTVGLAANQSGWYSINDVTNSSVIVSTTDDRLVTIGANGISIHLGGGFSAVFAVDKRQTVNGASNANYNKPYILLEGKTGNGATDVIGIKLSSNGIQVRENGDTEYVGLDYKIADVAN